MPRQDSRIQITDLLGRPGQSRRVDLVLPCPDDLGHEVAELTETVRFAGVIESVVEGLLARGTVHAPVRLFCARCLKAIDTEVQTEMAELFCDPEDSVDAGEAEVEAGYEIGDGEIDLDTLLRDALGPAMPYRPLCAPDCQGLCVTCGADRNEVACGCVDQVTDARWTALEGLRLDAAPSSNRSTRNQPTWNHKE